MSGGWRPAVDGGEPGPDLGRPLAAARALAAAHPRHLVLAALVAGLLVGPAPEPVVGVVMVAVAGLLAWLGLGRALVVVAVAAAGAGALGAQARLAALEATGLRVETRPPVLADAVMLEAPRRTLSGGQQALAMLRTGPGAGERIVVRTPPRARWPAAPVGAVLTVSGRLAPLGPRDDHFRRRHAHGQVRVGALRWDGRRRGGLAGLVDRIRDRAERALEAGLARDDGALLRGMVLGQDEALRDPVRDDFRAAGLAHLLAASGQNVALLAALALPALAWLGLGRRGRILGCLALVALYVPLAGAGPSIQRAGVMGAAGLVAALAGRPAHRWYALGLAAAVTLALNPLSAGDPGWQLSFAAVLAILALAGPTTERLRRRRVPPGLAEAGALTLAATLGTAPLLALHFERLSLVSLPANLLAAPAVAPLMWLGVLAALAGQWALGPAALLGGLNAYLAGYLQWLAHVAARLPLAEVAVPRAAAVALAAVALLAGCALAGTALAVRRRRRLVIATGASALCAAGGVACARATPHPPPPERLVVSFLDVGQGDATLLQHQGRAVLVDTGPPDGPILQRLRAAGVRRLDALLVTHDQADHLGAAAAVVRALPVDLLLDGAGAGGGGSPSHDALLAAARARTVRRAVPTAGTRVSVGPLRLDILWPPPATGPPDPGADPNQRAVVAHLEDDGFDLLLTADAESDVTAALPVPPVEALKVAHHGSADPGLPEQLRRLRPAVAVIEVGRDNPYGHPTASTLRALRSVPRVLRTDRDGTVRLTVDHGAIEVAAGS